MSRYRDGRNGELDLGIVWGLASCAVLLFVGLYYSGLASWYSSPISFILVFGGTLISAGVQYSKSDLQFTWYAFCTILRVREHDAQSKINYFVKVAQLVRTEGLLVLEQESRGADDLFLRTALLLAVDGQEERDIRRSLETEVQTAYERSQRAKQVFETMGMYAPSMGLIGTIIGLIQMLGSLNDPTTIGPAMALALITTLYGAALSNIIFLPLAGKLHIRAEEERFIKSLSIEAIVSLSKQENPMIIERRLQAFIPIQEAA